MTVVGGFLAIDEWLDHGKTPAQAGWSALRGLLRPTTLAAPLEDRLPEVGESIDLEVLETELAKHAFRGGETRQIAVLVHQAARFEEFVRRRQKANWLFDDESQNNIADLLQAYDALLAPVAPASGKPAQQTTAAQTPATAAQAAPPTGDPAASTGGS